MTAVSQTELTEHAAGLQLAADLTLPLETVTETNAILARKRRGKSYTAQKLAEQLLLAQQQVLVIDPTGAWWGLRSNAEGDGPGFAVIVFGGEHADAALDSHAGRIMARAAVEHGFAAIFDISLMTTKEQARFCGEFCSELYLLNRAALHLFIDEAQVAAPQKIKSPEQAASVEAVMRLITMGGIRGIGCTLISQRAAMVDKDVISQVGMLTLLSTTHPDDINTVTEWIKINVGADFAKEVKAELPSLPIGTAFVASADHGIAARVAIAPKITFNSGATPRPGERKIAPKVLAQVDLARLGSQVSEAAKQQRENSPEFLRGEIRRLQGELADQAEQQKGGVDVNAFEQLQQEINAKDERIATLEQQVEALSTTVTAFQAWLSTAPGVDFGQAEIERTVPKESSPKQLPAFTGSTLVATPTSSNKATARAYPAGQEGLSTAQLKILNALGSLTACGITTPDRAQVAFFAGYSNVKSGGFASTLR